MTDFRYQTNSWRFINRGLLARYVADQPPEGTYLDLTNLESRQENGLSSRYVLSILTVDNGAKTNLPMTPGQPGTNPPIVGLGRLLGLNGGVYNYAVVTSSLHGGGINGTLPLPGTIWRKSGDQVGGYTAINSGLQNLQLSGGRVSMFQYRPTFSSVPYIYICDTAAMLKDNGSLNSAQQMGINPPTIPAQEVPSAAPQSDSIATAANHGLVRLGNIVTVGCVSNLPSNFQVGATVIIAGAGDTSFDGTFTIASLGPLIGGVRTSFTYVQTGANATSGSGTATAQGVLSTGSGLPYDWRYTYYNDATGLESGPSMPYLGANLFTLTNQFANVSANASSDSQVTHWRLYRRGGILSDGWYRVAQIPISQLTFLDNNPDTSIQDNPQLNIDADPPVTSTLANPITTTIAAMSQPYQFATITLPAATTLYPGQLLDIGFQSGGLVEQVRVASVVSSNQFTAYLQFSHAVGDPITISTRPNAGMNLGAMAYDRLWLAGDPDNPNILYYSQRFNPETFPVENTLEIGTPSDPIMAVVSHRGFLYVFTQKKVYEVVAVGATVAEPIDTGVRHGLAWSFAWTLTEGGIVYLSQDGVYEFTGGQSAYLTEPIEWLFQGRSNGPLQPLLPLTTIPTSQPLPYNQPTMAYHNHEVFLSYMDTTSNLKRLIYHDVYKRWRNDTVKATAMYLIQDLNILTVALFDSPGNVFYDRVGTVKDGSLDYYGWDGNGNQVFRGISYSLQTPQTDNGSPKAFKNYNELTVDFDSSGDPVSPTLLFASGAIPVALAQIAVLGRFQAQSNVLNGLGFLSQNVALELAGTTTGNGPATFYEAHLRSVLEAEYRKSLDTYWLKFGSDEFKVAKQGWFEYTCQDPNGITVSAYLDGSLTTVAFSFNLPYSVTRTTARVRFPAFLGRLWRFVGTAAKDFQLYDDSTIEVKDITANKGYARQRLAP